MRRDVPSERQRQIDEVAVYLQVLYGLAGFKSWAEWARQAGLLASTLSDYQRGKNAPNGYNLLRLMQAAERRMIGSSREAALTTDPAITEAARLIEAMRRPLPDPTSVRLEDQGRAGDADDLEFVEAETERAEARVSELRKRRAALRQRGASRRRRDEREAS